MTNEQAKQIADTIAQQMGGTRRLSLMINAKNITYDEKGALSFSFMKGSRKVNWVRIRLDLVTDTYEMKFVWCWGLNSKEVKRIVGVYCDQLVSIFEDTTQLALRL